jgi:DNA-directed RNA polymerase
MLCCVYVCRAGISFVAVHDSYWTHACFVDTMNRICREQFVTLHNEPILSDLAQFLENKFGDLTYRDNSLEKRKRIQKCKFRDPFPTIGDLDLNQVLDSTYFFS